MSDIDIHFSLDGEELANQIADLPVSKVLNFVMEIDLAVAQWEFTIALHERLSAILKAFREEGES